MRIAILALGCLSLHGCGEPAARQPTEQQADVFMNKLEADEKAEKDVAVGEARFEEAERARAAEVRLEDAENALQPGSSK